MSVLRLGTGSDTSYVSIDEIRAKPEAAAGDPRIILGLIAKLDEADVALDQVMAERDRAEGYADSLAYMISPQSVIGEHSSGNCPWENALNGEPAEQ